MPVTLENRMRQMQVFNLPHHAYCKDRCACSEVAMVVSAENPRTGERAARHIVRKTPGSLTLLARERRAGLPLALLEVPEVKAAIASRRVRVVEETPDPPTGPASKAPAAASPPPTPATAKPTPVPVAPAGAGSAAATAVPAPAKEKK